MDAIKKILVPTDFSACAEEAFPACLEEARLLFEQILGYGNHLGLYAEQTGLSGEGLGNFPQAFTHLALISAAFNLDRALAGRMD
jgi:GH15 family glucan-1,4-alpha-glucosidase